MAKADTNPVPVEFDVECEGLEGDVDEDETMRCRSGDESAEDEDWGVDDIGDDSENVVAWFRDSEDSSAGEKSNNGTK